MTINSCEELPEGSRQRKICDGTSGLTLIKTNLYRSMWGLPPLSSNVVAPSAAVKSTVVKKPQTADTAKGGNCCGKKKSLVAKAVSLFSSLSRWTANGWNRATPEIVESRMQTCRSCPLFENGTCGDCGCVLKVKTTMDTEECPLGKWPRSAPPLQCSIGNPKKHLLYHIYPVAGTSHWKWNIEQLRQRIELFDGVRSIAIVTDEKTDSVESVKNEFAGIRIDNWIVRENNAKRREGVTFVDLMNTLPKDDGVVFYAHAKGVRHAESSKTVDWAAMMYETLLDDIDSILRHLAAFPIVGSFKRYGEFKLDKNHQWHYSGTFYWFRSQDVFAKPRWEFLQSNFFACIEAWPANLFESHEASCIFGDNAGNLYDQPELMKWTERLIEWRKARQCQKP